MPKMDDIVGNLGEPLDVVEYRVDDEDEHDACSSAEMVNADLDAGQRGNAADAVADKEAMPAHPSARDLGSATAPVDVIQLEEVCRV